jgi:acetylornithine deacetylase/succinyl-diaminopimelate desuccinylase-like protein
MPDCTRHPALAAIENGREQLTELLAGLIRQHPIYGSAGQQTVLKTAGEHLRATGYDVTRTQIDLDRLRASPSYVDVPAFGGQFASYGEPARSSLRAHRRYGGGGPHIILNGHVDVEFVTSPQTWSEPQLWRAGAVRDGRVYGRGASDMLGGVACYLHTIRALAPYADAARGAVTVQLVLDEEIGGNGTLWELLADPGPPADLAIISEPTDRGLCGVTRGFHQFSVVCPGAPVHMTFAGEYDNANRCLVDVLTLLERFDRGIAAQLSASGTRFVMYGTVHGGSDAAVPAESVEIGVTLALPPQLSAAEVQAEFERELSILAGRLPYAPFTRPAGPAFPGSASARSPLADLLAATAQSLGMPLTDDEFPSACDARLFAEFGIPAFIYGPGSLSRAHGSDEYVLVDELVEYCTVLGAWLLRVLGCA